jgi:hypothetical protein
VTRPPWEVADIIRIAGRRFWERYRASLTWPQVKVLLAIARCRTAALGGHLDYCTHCGYRTGISYNSCRNRHCPKCQTNAREKWLAKRQRELLPVHYFHLVFSVPHTLVPLMWQNKKILFSLLFEASAATLLELAADPKHLGAEIGFFSILHTWGQTLQPHPHIHCVVPGGGLSPDHQRWLSTAINFFLPVLVLSPVFRGKFLAGLRRASRTKQLVFHGECLPLAEEKAFRAFLDSLREQDWVVYAKPPFGGPEHVLHYLQPPHCGGQRISSALPLERLRPPQQTTHHAANLRRIPAPLRAARPPERVSAHPLLRLDGQSPTEQTASALSRSSPACGASKLCSACARIVAMPSLPCAHDGPGTIHTQRASRYGRRAGMHP